MILRQISKPKCFPVTLEQARKHLAIDSTDHQNDELINLLIESATADSQMKTGRLWVECEWEWKPDVVAENGVLEFPIVPVVDVKLYDLDRPLDAEPETPPDENEGNGDNDSNSGDNTGGGDGSGTSTPETFKARKRQTELDLSQYAEVSEECLDIEYPSLEPIGYPVIGSMTPKQAFPDNYKLILTVGYPTEAKEEYIEQVDDPVLDTAKTQYSMDKIRLIFNRPVSGEISPSNFELRKKHTASLEPEPDNPEPETPEPEGPETPETPEPDNPDDGNSENENGNNSETTEGISGQSETETETDTETDADTDNNAGTDTNTDIGSDNDTSNKDDDINNEDDDNDNDNDFPLDPDDELLVIESANFVDGVVELQCAAGSLTEGDIILLSFYEGTIEDRFNNFVQPINFEKLPQVAFVEESDYVMPEPDAVEVTYESLAPTPVKNWILTRTGSLYSQRTEIALRAGKSNDAMFPEQFINNLLNPYRVRWLG